jgi:hypothetical protein
MIVIAFSGNFAAANAVPMQRAKHIARLMMMIQLLFVVFIVSSFIVLMLEAIIREQDTGRYRRSLTT